MTKCKTLVDSSFKYNNMAESPVCDTILLHIEECFVFTQHLVSVTCCMENCFYSTVGGFLRHTGHNCGGICSLFGNSTLLYISYKKKHLLKPAEHFVINLAVSDLGLTLSLYPMAITSSFYHRWLYGKTVCFIYAFCGMLFGLCSLTTLTLLSMVCFVKVCYPLYGNRFNSRHGRLLIACAWIYALIFTCCPLIHWGEYGPEPYGTACCIDWHESNHNTTARSYIVVLFVFCYILPCCVIVASYTGILVTVQASRKTMEQHASRQTNMNSTQIIIVKLSVAVCIGFFAAWSPYAVVSMWASFGHVESISPLAFAIPALFAKSSTIYNPIVCLTLRPHFCRAMHRDLRRALQTCQRGCLCLKGQAKCCTKPKIKVRLRTVRQQNNQFPSFISAPQPPTATIKNHKCQNNFRPYTQMYSISYLAVIADMSKGQETPVLQSLHQSDTKGPKKLPIRRTSEPNNHNIHLEMVPRHTK